MKRPRSAEPARRDREESVVLELTLPRYQRIRYRSALVESLRAAPSGCAAVAPPSFGTAAFPSLVAPMSAAAFLAEAWEQRALKLDAPARTRFAKLFSLRRFVRYLASGALPPRAVQLRGGSGREGDADDPIQDDLGRHHGAHVLEHVADRGGSVLLHGLERFDRGCNELARDLSRDTKARVFINSYFTPAGAQTLGTHWDNEHVFVLQISGRKAWRVYDPIVRMPAGNQPYSTCHKLVPLDMRLRVECTLEEGDVLYVPRGFPHDALATAPSLHLTVAIPSLDWGTVLALATKRALELEQLSESMRRPPAGVGGAPFSVRAAELEADARAGDLARAVRRELARALEDLADTGDHPPSIASVEAAWHSFLSPPDLEPSVVLRRVVRDVSVRVDPLTDLLEVNADGRRLFVRREYERAIRHVLGSQRCAFGDIPSPSVSARRALVTALLRKGVLRAERASRSERPARRAKRAVVAP